MSPELLTYLKSLLDIEFLIPTLVAFIVVFLNQWYLTRRARKEIYIKKIEEIYICIKEYEDSSSAFISLLFDNKSYTEEQALINLLSQVKRPLERIDMYIKLHFPSEEFEPTKYDHVLQDMFKKVYKKGFSKLAKSYLYDVSDIYRISLGSKEQVIKSIDNNAEEIKNLAEQLMKKHRH
jgi:hypothetical protein